MRFVHLSDLHIGKRVNETSMLADQCFVLDTVLQNIDSRGVDTVFIAGDIYDKPVPSAEAVAVFDDFLTQLAKRNLTVFIISGNHDSAERIAFGSEIFSRGGIYTAGAFSGKLKKVTLSDEFGDIEVVLMPYLKPFAVREALGDETVESYNDAVRTALATAEPPTATRRIVLAHQFVTGATLSESESISVGGVDMIDAALFDGFCYAALGHIHRPQCISRKEVRYCGTLLKYNVGECSQKKTITFGSIDGDGNVKIDEVAVSPVRDMRTLVGDYDTLMSRNFYSKQKTDDYLYITLTDKLEIPDAVAKLKTVYPNIMQVVYSADNFRETELSVHNDIEKISPFGLFNDFFTERNGFDMTEGQKLLLKTVVDEIWGDEQ